MRGFNGSIVARGPPQGGARFGNSDIFIRDSAFGNLGYPYLDFRIVQSRIPVSGFPRMQLRILWYGIRCLCGDADTLVGDSVSLWRRLRVALTLSTRLLSTIAHRPPRIAPEAFGLRPCYYPCEPTECRRREIGKSCKICLHSQKSRICGTNPKFGIREHRYRCETIWKKFRVDYLPVPKSAVPWLCRTKGTVPRNDIEKPNPKFGIQERGYRHGNRNPQDRNRNRNRSSGNSDEGRR